MLLVCEMLPDLRKAAVDSARPQSMTSTSPNSPSMVFSGLMSRCITPRAWAKPMASATFIKISRFSPSDLLASTLLQGVPSTRFIE